MTSSIHRRDLIERLRYTFITADFQEIDSLISALRSKENFEELCEEFFEGCRIDSAGFLVPGGFFHDEDGSASLRYAMYEILGSAPDTFLLKHRVNRIRFLRSDLNGCFRLSKRMFSLPRLERLTIRGIGISRLPDAVGNAKSLKMLDLSANRFRRFPDILTRLPRLGILSLAHNMISEIPEPAGRLRSLKVLNLKGNQIRRLPEDWHRMQNLKILDLSMNRLTAVPESLGTLVSLRELRLAYNDLPAAVEAGWERRIIDEGEQGTLGFGG